MDKNRFGTIFEIGDQLEAAGIVGPQEGSKPRQVLIASPEELDLRLKELRSNP